MVGHHNAVHTCVYSFPCIFGRQDALKATAYADLIDIVEALLRFNADAARLINTVV